MVVGECGAWSLLPSSPVVGRSRVLFARDDGWYEAAFSPADAERVAATVFSLLDREPHFAEKIAISGGQLTYITVRHAQRWKSVITYAWDRDDFFAPDWKPALWADTFRSDEIALPMGLSIALQGPFSYFLRMEPRSAAFAAAYRYLVDSIPPLGRKRRPLFYDVEFVSLRRESRHPRASWPAYLPGIPAWVTPDHCKSGISDGCPLTVDERDAPALRKLVHFLRSDGHPYPVAIRGEPFFVNPMPRYAGQHTIDAIEDCKRPAR